VKQVAIGVGVAFMLVGLVPLVIAAIPFIVGLAGVAVLWFTIPRIIKGCFDIVNHDIWKM
jgi:hypothetical protein